jgi:hypothetical protein
MIQKPTRLTMREMAVIETGEPPPPPVDTPFGVAKGCDVGVSVGLGVVRKGPMN